MEKRNLLTTVLNALKPAPSGTTYDLMDKVVPGFGVRVSDKGRRTFILVARYGSKHPTRRALGVYPNMPLERARKKARDWLAMLEDGIDPAVAAERDRQAQIRQQAITFGAVAEDFITEKLVDERKGKEVERDIRREFIPKWAKRPIADITDEDVVTVIKAKKRTAPAQARNLLGIAKRMFAWAVDQRSYGLKVSPAETLRPTKIIGEKTSGKRVLTDAELFALSRAIERTPYPHGPAYRLLLITALRLNEAADASWAEFDPGVVKILRADDEADVISDRIKRLPADRKIWVIPGTRMKGRNSKARDHAVPLTDEIIDLLVALPKFKKEPYLFSTTFGKSAAWMSDKVKKRLDAKMLRTLRAMALLRGEDPATVTLPPWVNHDIRRTVRSNLSRLRVTEEAREAVLAHARPGIKGTYDHHDYLEEKREALELWAARLRSIVDPPPENVVTLHARA